MFSNLKKVLNNAFEQRKSNEWLTRHTNAQVTVGDAVSVKGKISVGDNSQLILEGDVQIEGVMKIGHNCSIVVRQGTRIKNTSFVVKNSATVSIGEGVIIDPSAPISVYVNDGSLTLGEKVHLQGNIHVRFGGKLSIGKYTGIGQDTEIRCHELMQIGEYGLISYDVCIYDTNTHSVDWKQRRERILKGYPIGAAEETRPDTEPVIIGDDVWIGNGATVLKGTSIGDRCIIGIRTVVSGGKYGDDNVIVMSKPRVIQRKI